MRSLLLASAVALGCIGTAQAAPYTADYIFGDSLSDRGNLADILGHNFPSPPFFHDSFTNGPTAVQVMAQKMGLTEDPSLFATGFSDTHGLGLTPGTNYAVAGATAGTTNGVPGANLPNQVAAFLIQSGGSASASALYTLFIGGNDVRTAAHIGNPSLVLTGVVSETAAINTLYGAGARNFLIVNVPDVGAIPEFQLGYSSQVQAAHDGSIAYDQALASSVASLSGADQAGSFKLFDFYSFNNGLLANPGSLGITNTTTPCYTSYSGVTTANTGFTTSAACGPVDPTTGQPANISSLFYWDAIHPTAQVQQAIGNALYAFEIAPNTASVPEPASLALLGAGVIGTAVVARRKRRG